MEKRALLEKTYLLLNEICWGDSPLSEASNIVLPNVMGYGTNIDEKLNNYEEFKNLIQAQRDQGAGFKVEYHNTPVYRRFTEDGNCAIYVDEILFKFVMPNGTNGELFLRISFIFEFISEKWILTHWHGSVPVQTEGDTWMLGELKKKNEELQKKVEEQTTDLRRSLEDLKATQAQLIHSEKMASLGELTAGIAHEIQNPLNFVNNFSEVNKELLTEMSTEIDKGNYAEVKSIAKDLLNNQDKINQHGKRADAIVKGMLQHSRQSSGQKEPTDINALCDEYLRLAYHGLRAKDKSFNAKFETHFDPALPKISVVPQDIGRVILNLINNAFYAVNEKSRLLANRQSPKANSQKPIANYEPLVTVTTKHLGDKIEVRIQDNGTGIPDTIKGKIFQPFFTTKPTGQGTGLGLSLAYDIVTKGHGGEITLEGTAKEGTTFKILI